MSEEQGEMENLVALVRRERDEIRVRLHLAKAEVRDQWAVLEPKREALDAKLSAIGKEAGAAAGNVAAALQLAAEELRQGYANIRKRL